MRRVLYLVGLLMCSALAIYGFYCALHMGEYIGSKYYWSNPWFYKGHATLFGLIALRILVSWIGRSGSLKDEIT